MNKHFKCLWKIPATVVIIVIMLVMFLPLSAFSIIAKLSGCMKDLYLIDAYEEFLEKWEDL